MKIKVRKDKTIDKKPLKNLTFFPKVFKKAEPEDNKQDYKKRSSIFYLIWFIIFVWIFIGIGFTAKTVFLLRKRSPLVSGNICYCADSFGIRALAE